MAPTDRLLKTRQLADVLGVHSSTIKRWVDQGELPASRTLGKHRQIPLSGAIRFARERGLPCDGLLGMLEDSGVTAVGTRGDETSWEEIAEALKRGRSRTARELIVGSYARGIGAAGLADRLIRPAMRCIGHDWERRSIDIFQEHRATRIVESALMELIRDQRLPAEDAPMAVGASPEGDLYTLPGLLCELALRELGWQVVNLGPNLPMPSFAKAIRVHRPKLAWLSISQLGDPDALIRDYDAFYATASRTGTAVVLGGSALTADLRAELVAAGFGDRIAHLREFAKGLQSPPPASHADGSAERPAGSDT